MMNSADIEQGSPEWLELRAGKVTASRIADVMATIKTGESASRQNYRAQLVAEILSGKPEDSFQSGDMKWGIEQEPYARNAYEAHSGLFVDQIGFVLHPEIEGSGASPDGLVGADGLVEIKCPKTKTHLAYILGKKPPAEYVPQMAWQCACTKRSWVDFVSYDPRLPESLQLFVVRYTPEPEYIKELETAVQQFIGTVNEMVEKLLETIV